MNISIFKKNNGFSMIELMASLFVLSFGILAIYNIFSGFIVTTNTVSLRLTASYLAKEGMEITRNLRDGNIVNDKNWDLGLKNCDNGCQADYKTGTEAESTENKLKAYNDQNFLLENSDGFFSYDAGDPSKFKRKITMIAEGSNALKVTSEVFWEYNSKTFSYKNEGYLYGWQ